MSKAKGPLTLSRFEPRRAARMPVVEQFQAHDVAGAGDREAQLQAILTHSRSPVFLKDAAGRYLRVNDEFVREFGLPRDAYLGRTDRQIFPADLARALQINDAL